MRHVHICRLSRPLARSLLLHLGLVSRRLLNLERVFAGGLLSNVDQLAVHVVDAGDGDAVPHDLELGLDRVVQRRVVGPDVAGEVVLLGADDEDLVLLLQGRQRLLAVGPAVLEVLDRNARGVRLALQVRQERCAVLDVEDDGAVRVHASLPCLFAQAGVWLPLHARVAPQSFRQLPLVLLRVASQAEVVDDLGDAFGLALLLEILHRKGHLRLDFGTVSRQLGLRKWHLGRQIALPLGRGRGAVRCGGWRGGRRCQRRRLAGARAGRVRELRGRRGQRAAEGGGLLLQV